MWIEVYGKLYWVMPGTWHTLLELGAAMLKPQPKHEPEVLEAKRRKKENGSVIR